MGLEIVLQFAEASIFKEGIECRHGADHEAGTPVEKTALEEVIAQESPKRTCQEVSAMGMTASRESLLGSQECIALLACGMVGHTPVGIVE